MKPISRYFLLVAAVLLPLRFIAAQDSASTLSIRGDIQKPIEWSLETLKAQLASQVQSVKFASGKDKQPTTGTGIPLLSVIQAAAPKTDQHINHHDLKFLVILEVLPNMRKRIFLDTGRNLKHPPLGPAFGPRRRMAL